MSEEEYEEFKNLPEEERLKAENSFLKMKLLLENGADVQPEEKLPPEVVNSFLKYLKSMKEEIFSGEHMPLIDLYPEIKDYNDKYFDESVDIDTLYDEIISFLEERNLRLQVNSPYVPITDVLDFIFNELIYYPFTKIKNPDFKLTIVYDEMYHAYIQKCEHILIYDILPFILGEEDEINEDLFNDSMGFRFNNSTNPISISFIQELVINQLASNDIAVLDDFEIDRSQSFYKDNTVHLEGKYHGKDEEGVILFNTHFEVDFTFDKLEIEVRDDKGGISVESSEIIKLTHLLLSHFSNQV